MIISPLLAPMQTSSPAGSAAPPMLGQYIAGNYYDGGIDKNNFTMSAVTVAADRMELVPFITPIDLVIDQVGLVVTATGGDAKVIVYASDSNGWPSTLIKETGNLSMGTAAPTFVGEAWSYTFTANTKYWVGFRSSAGGQLRSLTGTWMPYLGRESATSNATFGALRRTLAFGTAAPSTWSFTSSDLAVVGNSVNVLFRAA